MKISEVMVKDPVFAKLPATREDVLTALIKNRRTGMPVVDSEGKVLGIITRKDIFQNPGEQQVAVIMEWDVPTVSPGTSVGKAASIMFDDDIRRLPVVNKGKLEGLVTPSDMLKVIVKEKITDPVEDFVRSPTICLHKSTPINVAATIMNLGEVYALPVLDDNASMCGIVTDRDLFDLNYLDESITLTTLGISEDEDAWTWEGIRNVMNLYYQEAKIDLPREPISKFMSKKPTVIYEKAPAWKAAREMRKKDFDQLPVVDNDDELRSMLYDMDLMKVLKE